MFSEVVGGKRRKKDEEMEVDRPKSKKKRQSGRDEEFYIPYRPKDFNSERGYDLDFLMLVSDLAPMLW